jgi:phosphohistidine phosphatase SixA
VDLALLRTSLATDEGHLSLEGRQIVRALGNRIRLNEDPSFDRFVTSPAPAAVQTAELFADRVDWIGIIEVLPTLGGGVPPEVVAKQLFGRGESIVVVGDEPFLSALGAFLVGRPTFPPLVHSQVSIIKDRTPAWCFRPGETGRSQLLVA